MPRIHWRSMTYLHTIPNIRLRAVLAGALCISAPMALGVGAAPATAQATAQAPARADQLDQVVSALRAISTMQADFTQTDRNGQSLRGKLTLKAPGRIRFEYEKSVNMLLVSNGKSLTLIDYDVQQVQRWPIANSPLGALLDPTRDVKRFGKLVSTGNPEVLSIQVRDPKKPEYGTITLIMLRKAGAPGGLELNSWVALDAQNARTTVRLANHRYGMAVPDSTFAYRDPRAASNRPR